MMTIAPSPAAERTGGAPPARPAGPAAPQPDGAASRIDRLFRDALRCRQVHPLMDLVRRYREQVEQ